MYNVYLGQHASLPAPLIVQVELCTAEESDDIFQFRFTLDASDQTILQKCAAEKWVL